MRFLSFLPMLLFAGFLSAQNNCNISGLTATVSAIDPATCQYTVVLNFDHTGTTNQFNVKTNGTSYGTFTYNQLPLTVGPFTAGNAASTRTFLVRDAVFENCVEDVAAAIPGCAVSSPCNIFDVVVTTGDCQPNSNTYSLTLDFEVTEPTNSQFEVWAGNTQYLGIFPLSALPVQISNFPASGNANDIIRICINDNEGCCEYKEFVAPDCNPTPCNIYDVVVTTGDCLPGTNKYTLTLDFEVTAPTTANFGVWTSNNTFLGNYALSALPVQITNFPASGNNNDVIKICINDNPNCCEYKEFPAPDCNNTPCEITPLVVTTGECHNNGTYQVTVNFDVASISPLDSFMVFANGGFLGKFGINQLPLTIQNFPWNGGATDVIKICVANDQTECCRMKEFAVPDCLAGPCEIFDLVVDPGQCTSNQSYSLLVNFQVSSTSAIDSFVVFANGAFLGKFGINQLPLTIPNFPSNGGHNDVIKVCVANALAECCRIKEFPVPGCLSGPCQITNLVVDPGQCTSNTTYSLFVNFGVVSPTDVDSFLVFANGVFFGKFGLNQLPLNIPNFPYNGGPNDVIKVCVANNTITGCCETKEFVVPGCLSGPCQITDLAVDPGDCTSTTTYSLFVNFGVVAPGIVDSFLVFANGNFFGKFGLNQLPLNIPNFPYNGGTNDVIKVCVGNNVTECCRVLEFPVPDCLNQEPCAIYDLHVQHTPCLCGQFFAVLDFKFQQVGSGGFDIVGNGNNYGTFPYNHPQPIILGPFQGNGTNYEFVVRDHNHPDCRDAVELGEIVCMVPVTDPGSNLFLNLSPNPAGDWLQVSAQLDNGLKAGQSNVDVYSADGRLVIQQVVADGGNFQLDVSALPAGMYRLVVMSEAGRMEGTFAKR